MKAAIKYLIAMPGFVDLRIDWNEIGGLQFKQNVKRKLKLIMLAIGRLKHDENGYKLTF